MPDQHYCGTDKPEGSGKLKSLKRWEVCKAGQTFNSAVIYLKKFLISALCLTLI